MNISDIVIVKNLSYGELPHRGVVVAILGNGDVSVRIEELRKRFGNCYQQYLFRNPSGIEKHLEELHCSIGRRNLSYYRDFDYGP